jgi:hypothetical protein
MAAMSLNLALLAVPFRVFSSRVFVFFVREGFELQGRRSVDLPEGKFWRRRRDMCSFDV